MDITDRVTEATMFVSTCNGCIQVPNTVYFWNPYQMPGYLKKPQLHLADILQVTQNLTKTSGHLQRQLYSETSRMRGREESSQPNIEEILRKRSSCVGRARISQTNVTDTNEAINYSTKVDSAKCSLPSALEPLQALCSTGVNGYGASTHVQSGSPKTTQDQTRELKFGMNRILADDFGKEPADKENTPKSRESQRPRDRPCECTYENCHVYQHARFPNHALTAVHALQPPKYPNSPSGTDVLPGPYSVLNSDVTIGPHAKRKRSWSRAVFSNLQRKGLEKRFEVQKYVTKPDRRQLAAMLGLTDAQVKVWFQNRRMKWRHAQQTSEPENEASESNMADTDPAGTDVTVQDDVTESLHPTDSSGSFSEMSDDDDDDNLAIENAEMVTEDTLIVERHDKNSNHNEEAPPLRLGN